MSCVLRISFSEWVGGMKKVIYFPMNLLDEVLTYFGSLEWKQRNFNLGWGKKNIITVFAPGQEKEMLLMRLNNRVKLQRELVIKYRTDIELLCVWLDVDMEEYKLCEYILKGLNPALLHQIAMLTKSTINKLETNIQVYYRVSYLMRECLWIIQFPVYHRPRIMTGKNC